MNEFRQILEEGIQLLKQGNLEAALNKFNGALKLVPKKSDERWIVHLYRNIGLLQERKGNLMAAKRSYLRSLKYGESDPYTYFWLGDLSDRLQQMNAARRYYTSCRELAVQNQDQDLLEMLLKRGYK